MLRSKLLKRKGIYIRLKGKAYGSICVVYSVNYCAMMHYYNMLHYCAMLLSSLPNSDDILTLFTLYGSLLSNPSGTM